jgi:hypothetical protein
VSALLVVLVFAAWVPAVAFPVLYARSDWRSNPVGRSTMNLAVVIAVALSIPVLRLFVGDAAWLDWLRAGAFLLIAAALWRQLLVLRRVQRRDRDTETV